MLRNGQLFSDPLYLHLGQVFDEICDICELANASIYQLSPLNFVSSSLS